jgi:hypothetical protein
MHKVIVQCKCYLQQEPMSHAQGHRPMQMLPPTRTNVTFTRSSSNANVTSNKNQYHMHKVIVQCRCYLQQEPIYHMNKVVVQCKMLPPTRTNMSHARGHRPMEILPPTTTTTTTTTEDTQNLRQR